MLLIGCSSLYYRSKGESADILTLMRRADHTDRRCWFSGFRFVPYSPCTSIEDVVSRMSSLKIANESARQE